MAVCDYPILRNQGRTLSDRQNDQSVMIDDPGIAWRREEAGIDWKRGGAKVEAFVRLIFRRLDMEGFWKQGVAWELGEPVGKKPLISDLRDALCHSHRRRQ